MLRCQRGGDLASAELLAFDQAEWERQGDNGRWPPARLRWIEARKAFCAAHPDSGALGNRLERMQTEHRAQFTPEHYPPNAGQ